MVDATALIERQRVLADFGDFVLDNEDMDAVLNEACRLVARALDADLAKVIQIERTSGTGFVRAGVGWGAGIVGHERILLSESSSEAYAIERSEPVITNDLASETRFHFPNFLREHGVVALVNVPIFLPGRRPWGVLQVDARRPHEFADQDIEFLKTYSMALGPVIDRFETVRQREEARLEVEDREQRLHRILDGMGEGFGILGPDFTILEHNREATRMDGRSREEIIGRSHWEVYPGTETSELGLALKRAMAKRVPVSLEHKVMLSSDRTYWFDMRAYPTRDGCLAVFWRDVTARHAAMEALRESREQLVGIFEGVPAAVAAVDPSGKAVLANGRYLALFPTATIPSRDPDRVHRWRGWDPEGKPLAPENFPGARALRGESVLPGQEMLFVHDDGHEVWTSVAAVPTRDEERRITGFVTVIADISESKAVEAALRESEGRLQTIMHGIPQLVWRGAKDGTWTWVSPQWEAYTGLAYEQSKDQGWLCALHPDDREHAREAWATAGHARRLEFDCRLGEAVTGEFRWFQTRALPVLNPDGTILEWLGTCTDVHELRELQERQKVLVGELQHRTRNLLAVIGSICEKTARGSENLEDFRKRYRDRLDAMARVQGLLSRLGPDDRVTFDELIESELAALGPDDGSGKVKLSGPRAVRLRSSTVQTLAMALHELTTNAIKHGALGQAGARLEVNWEVESTGDDNEPRLRIEWRESGVAMRRGEPFGGAGQGRELIEKALPFQLGAYTEYLLGPDGVHCTIRVPVSQTQKIGLET